MNVKHTYIDRVRLTGAMSEIDKAWKYCEKNGYRLAVSGPKFLRTGQIDPTKFGMTIEKEVKL